MSSISAIIISFNEAARIGDCLKSLQGVADEVIVVDNGSTDGTQAIAETLGAKVFQQAWLGYGPQKNFAISKTTQDWILQVDCDERLDESLRATIIALKNGAMNGAYEIPFLHNYYGKFIRHGLQFPDKKLRLWNKQYFIWDDRQVHESLLIPEGFPITRLKGFMLHYSYTSLEHHISKSNRYSTEGAIQLYRKGKKNYWWKIWISPGFTFFNAYIIRMGLLDGWHGFVIAKMEASTTFMKYAKLWELWKNGGGDQPVNL
ncbi:MAG: glycosyltransferase family 2 protein [Chitinophagaceae bacterium]